MAKRKKWNIRSNKSLTTLSIKIAVIGIITTSVVAIAVVFLSHYLNRLPVPEGGLTPVGGKIDNQPIIIENKYGYMSYDNLNRREAFDAYLKENLYSPSSIASGKFDQCSINLLATNKGNDEIFITGLTCKISNIRQINEPLLLAVGEIGRAHV